MKEQPIYRPPQERSARRSDDQWSSHAEASGYRVARARGLTDPLGAKGHRKTRPRVLRETAFRGRLFIASIVTFGACFGVILRESHQQAESALANDSIDNSGDVQSNEEGVAWIAPESTLTPTAAATETPSSTATRVVQSETSQDARQAADAAITPLATDTPQPTETVKRTTPVPTATPKRRVRTHSSR